MRSVRALLVIIFLAAVSFAQSDGGSFDITNYGVRIDPDKRLIVVLAAIDAARTIDNAGKQVRLVEPTLSEAGTKFRDQVAADTSGLPEELRGRISQFITQYKKRHPKQSDAEIVSPFISMAYTLSPAPELSDPAVTTDLPGNLLDVLDFAPLAREFYRRSGIAAKLDDYVKKYRIEADGVLRASTREMVSDMLDYLHTRPQLSYTEKVVVATQKGKSKSTSLEKVEYRNHERRFVVVPEMFAPAESLTFLNIRDDYFVILPADKDLSRSEAKRAFLQFIVDPLVLSNSKDVSVIKDGIKSLLDDRRKVRPEISPDIFRAVAKSLVSAIEIRQAEYTNLNIVTNQARERIDRAKTPDERQAAIAELDRSRRTFADESALELSEAYEAGAVMAFYFAEELKGTEDSGFDIASSMREMIATFDAAKEKDRLSEFADARKRAAAAREKRRTEGRAASVPADNPITLKLLEIQKSIDANDLAGAATGLKQLQAENPSEPRIYYNIGRVASLMAANMTDPEAEARKLLEAQTAYSNVLRVKTASTPKALLSLTFVALGRIYEHFNNAEYAQKLYEEAIKLGDIPDGGYRDAITAKQRLLQNPQ